jgi:hypothetical protein
MSLRPTSFLQIGLGVFLLFEVIGHADDYDTFLEEECAFKH